MAVLAAITESEYDEKVISEAIELAEAFGDELHVVNVRTYDSLNETDATTAPNQSVKEAVTAAAADAVGKTDVPTVPVGLIGTPEDELLQYAGSVEPRYIVIGDVRRSPLGKAIFGSRMQTVILGADCPVLTVVQ
jgi:nucleotide-binding universal stress UspA family protein